MTLLGNTTGGDGGGLIINGMATLTNVIFSNNTAAAGGGIRNNNAMATLINVTFSGNTATSSLGGGMRNDGTATLTNVTFSGNSATLSGGGIFINATAVATVTNSTISGNSAGNGGGLHNGGTVTVSNTVIANNNTGGNCSGPITNGGHNLDSGSSCGWGSDNGSMSNTNPLLGPLADNGGPTQTMALLAGSPAINAGDNAICAAPPVNGLDQRGVMRPQERICDIGAYEWVNPLGGAWNNTWLILRQP